MERKSIHTTQQSDRTLAYWKSRVPALENPFKISCLPTGNQGTPVVETHTLSAEASAFIAKVAKGNPVGTFICVSAAWSYLLSKLERTSTVAFNVPEFQLKGVQSQTDRFLTTSVSIDESISVKAFIGQIKSQLLELIQHQYFDVAGFCAERDLTLKSDVMLMSEELHHLSDNAVQPELTIQLLKASEGETIKFKVSYQANEHNPEFASKLIAFLDRILVGFSSTETLLESLAFETKKEANADIQTKTEQLWEEKSSQTILDLFNKQVDQHPDRIALKVKGQEYSYTTLQERSSVIANALNDTVKNDAFIPLLVDRSVEMILGMLAILKLGKTYIPIDPTYPKQRIDYILKDSGATTVLTTAELTTSLSGFQGNVVDIHSLESQANQATKLPQIEAEQPAYIIYTSGTTGNPKGCMVTHFNVVNLFKQTALKFDFSADDCWLMAHSFCFDFSVWEIYGALLTGGKLIMPEAEQVKNITELHTFVCAEKVTVFNSTPGLFQAFTNVDAEAGTEKHCNNLRYVIFGGERLEPKALLPWTDKYGVDSPELINMYGITETTVHSTFCKVEATDLTSSATVSYIGMPLPGSRIDVCDDAGRRLPDFCIGELRVSGGGVSAGYHDRIDLNAEKFVADKSEFSHPSLKRKTTYLSGDLGRWIPGKGLQYLGRKDTQVKVRGYRIELDEISVALLDHPQVTEVVTIARNDDQESTTLASYYTVSDDCTTEVLRNWLLEKLPDYMVPAWFVQLDVLPLNANGKYDQTKLPDPRQERQTEAAAEARNEVEAKILTVWKEFLGVESFGIDHNFFEWGGDSIKVVKLVYLMNENAGVEISAVDLLRFATIRTLFDEVISKQELQEKSPLVLPLINNGQTTFFTLSWSNSAQALVEQLNQVLLNINFGETQVQFNDDKFELIQAAKNKTVLAVPSIEELGNHTTSILNYHHNQAAGEVRMAIHPALQSAFPLTEFVAEWSNATDKNASRGVNTFQRLDAILSDQAKVEEQSAFWTEQLQGFDGSLSVSKEAKIHTIVAQEQRVEANSFLLSQEELLRFTLLQSLLQINVQGDEMTWACFLRPKDISSQRTFGPRQRFIFKSQKSDDLKSALLNYKEQISNAQYRQIAPELLMEIPEGILTIEAVVAPESNFKTDSTASNSYAVSAVATADEIELHLNLASLEENEQFIKIFETTLGAVNTIIESEDTAQRTVAEFPAVNLTTEDLSLFAGNVEAVWPLSDVQSAMVYHSLLSVEKGVYRNYQMISFNALEQWDWIVTAIQRAAEKHELLRAKLVQLSSDEYVQAIAELNHNDLPISKIEWKGATEAEFEKNIADWTRNDQSNSISFLNDYLYQFTCFTNGEDLHRFVFLKHHAIEDGWSISFLFNELLQDIDALAKGEELASVQLLSGTYFDYIQREQKVVASAEHTQYWTEYLKDYPLFPAPKNLYEGLGEKPFVKATHSISSETFGALGKVAASSGVPIKHVLIAAFHHFLCRISGRENAAFGVVEHGRLAVSDGLNIFGCLLNSLPFTSHKEVSNDLKEMVLAIHDELLGMKEYSGLPLARIKPLHPDRIKPELFEILFNFVDFHEFRTIGETDWSDGLNFDVISEIEILEVPFECTFSNSMDMPSFGITLDGSRYSQETLEHFVSYLVISLDEFAALATTSKPMLSLTEKDAARIALSNGPLLETDKESTLVSAFRNQVGKAPKSIAVSDNTQSWTYQELDEQSDLIAYNLSVEHRIVPGDIVAVKMDRDVALVAAILGILKTGAAYVPIDPAYPKERINYIAEDSNAKLVIDGDWMAAFKQSSVSIPEDFKSTEVNASATAYLIYTSGSTGKPKGVEIQHRSAAAFINWCQTEFDASKFDTVYGVTSVCFDLSIFELFFPLSIGKTLRILPSSLHIADALKHDSKVLLNTVPSVVGNLLEEHVNWEAVTVLNMAGEPIPEGYISQLDCDRIEVRNLYGPSEYTTYSTVARLKHGEAVSIGKPIANTKAHVLNTFLQELPIGAVGELYLSGAGIAKGYHNRPELTAERFLKHEDALGGTMYRTGDLVRRQPNGMLDFIGRGDDQVKIRGFRIEPGEIQECINNLSYVTQAIVMTKSLHNDEATLIAYYQLSEETTQSVLRAELESLLPDYMIPALFMELDEFPLTPNGKIDKQALPMPSGNLSEQDYVAAVTQTEKEIVSIWEDLLQVSQIGMEDNFFSMGGHSLKLVRLRSALNRHFEIQLDLPAIFSNLTPQAQAQLVDGFEKGTEQLIVPIPHADDYPVSAAQRRMFVLNQFESAAGAYNMPGALTINGFIDVEAFEHALLACIDRHETLRTIFIENEEGLPRQKIVSSQEVEFKLGHFENVDADSQEFQQELAQLFAFEFDLGKGPLIQVTLWQTGEAEYVLGFVMHHIISDGWSMNVLVGEVLEAYHAFHNGQKPAWKALKIQYKDYAAWLNEPSSTQSDQEDQDYWKQQFDGDLPVLELPSSKSRPVVKEFEGAHLEAQLNKELTEGLKRLSKEEGGTLFMSLMTALNALFHRYTNQTDFILGTPIAGRDHIDLEGQIGLYLNTLALRTQFDKTSSVRELFNAVKHSALGAYEHQHYPFDQVVDSLGLKRDLGRSPLFDVMLVLQNFDNTDYDVPTEIGFTTQKFPADHSTSQFDLTLSFVEIEGELRVGASYATSIFAEQDVVRFLAHFEQLTKSLIESFDAEVGALNYLSIEEKEQVVVEFNQSKTAYPHDLSITDVLLKQMAETPDKTAVIHGDESLTYAELDQQSNLWANYLIESHNVEQGDNVALLLDRSTQMIACIIGIWKAGGTYVPIPTNYPADRVQVMLDDAAPKVVVNEELLREFAAKEQESVAAPINRKVAPDQVAYIMYTSGSMGKPKGVQVIHRNIVRLVKSANYAPLTADEVILSTGSVAFDAVTYEYWGTLANGGTLVLCDQDVLLDSDLLTEQVNTHKVSTMWLTAGLMNHLVEEAPSLFANLKTLIAGGDRLSVQHIAILKELYPDLTITNGYGPTENTTFSLTYNIEAERLPLIPIGKPINNSTAYILEENEAPVGIGVVGELHVGGDGVAKGYLNQPELTAQQFISDPFCKGGRLYKTGDLAKWLPDGNVVFIGRKDAQVKIRGYRVELGEIESVIQENDAVNQAVVTVFEEQGTKKVAAYYVAESELENTELLDWLKGKVPDYMLPSSLIELEEMPLNANGKVDHRALPNPKGKVITRTYKAPTTELESDLVVIWQDVLAIEQIGLQDNFFEIGGHSINATVILSRVYKELGVRVGIQKLFMDPTIENMAEQITNLRWLSQNEKREALEGESDKITI
jgi:amino acid adenylation domain-containing protein